MRGLDTDTEYDRKRRAIVQGAAEVFAKRGFVAGTTKEIAAKVGLSQPAIYHYLGSKEDLLREIVVRIEYDMRQALDTGLAIGSTPEEQLREIVRQFTIAIIENRTTFTVYYKELHQLPRSVRERISAAEREFVAEIAAVVAKLQRDGRLPEDKPATVLAEGIIGMVSWTHRWYRASGPLDADAIAETFLALICLSG
jgi:AcrR family transcriptional regulator